MPTWSFLEIAGKQKRARSIKVEGFKTKEKCRCSFSHPLTMSVCSVLWPVSQACWTNEHMHECIVHPRDKSVTERRRPRTFSYGKQSDLFRVFVRAAFSLQYFKLRLVHPWQQTDRLVNSFQSVSPRSKLLFYLNSKQTLARWIHLQSICGQL